MKKNTTDKVIDNIPTPQKLSFEGDYIDLLPAPVIIVDNALIVKRLNAAARNLFKDPIINTSFTDIFDPVNTNEKQIFTHELFNGMPKLNYEVALKIDGKLLNFLVSTASLKDDHEISQGYIITLTEITKQIENLNIINTELKEKSILLKEIHHRIKNNLQIINSILTLQMYYAQNQELSVLLVELQARIRTIALIHEKLYQTDNPTEINICSFMKDLSKILIQIYDVNSDFIRFICDIEEIVLETDIVLQLGLIINELITNSIKHAFPSGKGEILVSFQLIGDKYELHFKDDGIGIPDNFLSNKTETLGSQLLETLIQQLNGTLKIKSKPGTEYIITFPGS